MKPRNALAIALVLVAYIGNASAYTEEEIALLCPLREAVKAGEASREIVRDGICRAHPHMEEELGIDSNAREQIIDALTDRQYAQSSRLSSTDAHKEIRARAETVTNMLSRVRAAIGDERMNAFYVYMHNDSERNLLRVLTRRLSPDAQLSADQKAQLMVLFLQRTAQFKTDDSPALWQPVNTHHEFTPDELQLINDVNRIAAWQVNLLQTMELDAQLETEAAKFLTAQQMEALKRVNMNSVRSSQRYVRREWMAIDQSKLPDLQRRIAALPRQQIPVPVSGNIEIEFMIAIDDRKPLTGTRSLLNGSSITLEAGELLVDIKPTLYKKRHSKIDIDFFARIGGERRRLEKPTGSGNGELTFIMVEGVRKGYFVRTSVEIAD